MADQDPSPIDAIIEDLVPLASRQRGAPLRADDWNQLVDAVRELALIARGRAVATSDALAAGYASVEHEHLGEVGLDWFDGPTRALVEGRSASDFSVRDDITRIDKGVVNLRSDVEGLRGEVNGLRELVLQLRDEVIGGNRDLGKVKLRVEALKDVELGVDRIGRDFAKLDGKLGEVLVLRDKIGDGEGQIDLAGLGQRVGALETMRQQLIGNSQAPDLRALQQDMTKLADRLAGVGPGAPVELGETSKAQLQQLVDAELATTKARLDALDGKAAAHDALLDSQATSLGKLADYDAGLGRISALESSVGGFEGKLGQLDQLDQRTKGFGEQLGALDGKLAGVDKLIDDKLGTLELGGDALAGLGSRLDTLEGGLSKLDGQFAGLGDLGRFADKTALDQLGSSLANLSAASSLSASKLDTLAQSFADAGAGLDDLGTRLGKIEGSTLALGDWRGTVDGKLADLAKLGSASIGENAAALALRIGDLEASQATWNTWRTGTAGRLDALEVDFAAAGESRTLLADQVAGQQTTLAGLGEQLGGLTSNLAGIASWRGGVDGQLETLGSRASELESWKGDANASLSDLGKSLDGLGDLGTRIGALEGAGKSLGEWQSSVDGQLGTLDSKLAEQTKLGDRVGALEGLQLGKLDGRIAGVEGSLAKIDKSIADTKLALDGQAARLTSAEGSLSTLSKDMSTTKSSVKTLSDSLSATSKTLDGITTWRSTVDSKLGLIEGKQSSLSEWQLGIDNKLVGVDQTLGSLSGVTTRLNSLEATSKSLTTWQKQTDLTLGDLQVGVSKANELGGRLDKVDNQLISLSDSNAKLMNAAKLQPAVTPSRLKPLGG
ncbi:hypothetical protein ACNOYE_28310 [Nannocystaceae bacterium ST9]